MITVGIDPGRTGAIAALDTHSKPVKLEIINMPINKADDVDGSAICRFMVDRGVEAAVLEEAWSRPGNSTTSSTKFMVAYGIVLGALQAMGLPFVKVPPATWKRHMGLEKIPKGEVTKIAQELFPQAAEMIRNHNMAEAALLAYWGMKTREVSGEQGSVPMPGHGALIAPSKPGLILPGVPRGGR